MKQETLEEAIDRISKENGYDIEGGKVADFVDGMVKGAKWQQERMYSEAIDLFITAINTEFNNQNWDYLEFIKVRVIEQLKNK